MAALDDRFALVAAITSGAGEYRVRTEGLDRYLQPKKPEQAGADRIREEGRGIAYTTPAFAYVFRFAG